MFPAVKNQSGSFAPPGLCNLIVLCSTATTVLASRTTADFLGTKLPICTVESQMPQVKRRRANQLLFFSRKTSETASTAHYDFFHTAGGRQPENDKLVTKT